MEFNRWRQRIETAAMLGVVISSLTAYWPTAIAIALLMIAVELSGISIAIKGSQLEEIRRNLEQLKTQFRIEQVRRSGNQRRS